MRGDFAATLYKGPPNGHGKVFLTPSEVRAATVRAPDRWDDWAQELLRRFADHDPTQEWTVVFSSVNDGSQWAGRYQVTTPPPSAVIIEKLP